MGLTGIIPKIAFYLRPVDTCWIKQKTIPTKNIRETINIFEKNLTHYILLHGLIAYQEVINWVDRW